MVGLSDLLPSFRDPDYPADDYIDEVDNLNTAGVVETINFPINILVILTDLLPSFRDPDYPADDYIDEDDNYNTAGVVETINFPFNIFGYSF